MNFLQNFFLLFSLYLSPLYSQVLISDLDADYLKLDLGGTAQADRIYVSGIDYIERSPEIFSFELINDLLILDFKNTSLRIIDPPGIFFQGEQMQLKGFGLSLLSGPNNSSKIESLKVNTNKGEALLENMFASCRNLIESTQISLLQIIEGCTEKGELKGSMLKIPSSTQTLFQNIDLQVAKKNFSLTTKLKSSISGNVKIEGELKVRGDFLEMKVAKAKLGVIGIRGQLFKMLEQYQSPQFIVNSPYLKYKIK
jgi:hypothetical protein